MTSKLEFYKWVLFFWNACGVVAADDHGDDFSNNLFTDLAPVLALFGEKVTMQFISQSMGWADNVLLAMLPLGIITTIISAIRVSGPPWLKAIIGRARENLAAAEVDIMSSTSNEVCEVWNGREVVRTMGKSPIREFIICMPARSIKNDKVRIEVKTIAEALDEGCLTKIERETWRNYLPWRPYPSFHLNSGCEADQKNHSHRNIMVIRNTSKSTPNLTLNSHDQVERGEVRFAAVIGVFLQVGVLLYSGFATYYSSLRFKKGDRFVQSYAFPCYAVGTIALVIGVVACAHVVESRTEEQRYKANPDACCRIVWLQEKMTVSDQVFQASAVFTRHNRKIITTSSRLEDVDISSKGHQTLLVLKGKTIFGAVVSMCGFILQFVGLRELHWSISVTQLVAMLIMTSLRVVVRRGLATPPESAPITPGYELEWLALTLRDPKHAPWLYPSRSKAEAADDWQVISIDNEKIIFEEEDNQFDTEAHRIIQIRRDLGKLTSWPGLASGEAIALARAIEATMNNLYGSSLTGKFSWSLTVRCSGSEPQVAKLHLEREPQGPWKANADELEAALSLWLYSAERDMQSATQESKKSHQDYVSHKDDSWLRSRDPTIQPNLHLLGHYSQGLHQDLQWWMPTSLTNIKLVKRCRDGTATDLRGEGLPLEDEKSVLTQVQKKRIVGFQFSSVVEHSESRTERDGHMQFESWNLRNKHNFWDSSERMEKHLFIASESYMPLKTLYAQHMFTEFMRSISASLPDPIEGDCDAQSEGSSGNFGWISFTLQNKNLSKLAQKVAETGLGNLDQIYICLIPPLSGEMKLPSTHKLVEMARDQALPYERLQHWNEALDCYSWLLNLLKSSPNRADMRLTALNASMELLRVISQAIITLEAQQWREAPPYADKGIHMLEILKDHLKTELRYSNKETLHKLMEAYKDQNRGWECDLLEDDTSTIDYQSVSDLKEEYDGLFCHSIRTFLGAELQDASLESLEEDGVNDLVDHVDERDIYGWTVLHYAAARGCEDAARRFIDEGAKVNAQDYTNWTPLHYACKSGNIQIIEYLLANGADPMIGGRDETVALHCAAIHGHLNAVRLMIQTGAAVDHRDASGSTALHWAAFHGHTDIVRYIGNSGNKELRDQKGRTALHLAAAGGSNETVRVLLEELNVDKESGDRNGRTVLHWAVSKGNKNVIEFLVSECKADVNAKNNVEQTPLHWAAAKGDEGIVKFLVFEAGADIEASNNRGERALHYAVVHSQEAIARFLALDQNAEIEAQTLEGLTPLHMAAMFGQADIMRMLIFEAHAQREARDNLGKTPLHRAIEWGSFAEAKILVIEANATADTQDIHNETPLHEASRRGDEKSAQLLIVDGKANREAKDCNGWTALHMAVSGRKEGIVRQLALEYCLNKKARDIDGRTPLHIAAMRGSCDLLGHLLYESRSNLNVLDNKGMTPIHLAAIDGIEDVVEYLVCNTEIDPGLKNHEGHTALDLAIENGHPGVVKVLQTVLTRD